MWLRGLLKVRLEDEKDENVAIVMHDLKSPVTTVRSLARLGKGTKFTVVLPAA